MLQLPEVTEQQVTVMAAAEVVHSLVRVLVQLGAAAMALVIPLLTVQLERAAAAAVGPVGRLRQSWGRGRVFSRSCRTPPKQGPAPS